MGIDSLVDAPTNEPEPVFHIDATNPLVAALPTDPHSLLAPYTDIIRSDALDDDVRSAV